MPLIELKNLKTAFDTENGTVTAVNGLDVRLQKQVAATLAKVCRELAITLLIITHNLKIAHALCDEVSVMHGGRILETAPRDRFFSAPRYAYSQKMVDAYFLFAAGMEKSAGQKVQRC